MTIFLNLEEEETLNKFINRCEEEAERDSEAFDLISFVNRFKLEESVHE